MNLVNKAKIHIKQELILLLMIAIIASAFLVLRFFKPFASEGEPTDVTVSVREGQITVKGKIVCLPHKNSKGPQTLECAYGLKDEKGVYYALSSGSADISDIGRYDTDREVLIAGNLNPQNDTKYQNIGVIEVENISYSDSPQRATLEGTVVCLPKRDTDGPVTMECALGLLTEEGEYYALDFGLMSQQKPELDTGYSFKANGVIIPLETLSSDHWRIYQIKGIFSVTDSIKINKI